MLYDEEPPTITISYSGYGHLKMHVLPGDTGWPELMDEFRNFLNGIGYCVPIGEWVEDDDES